MSIEWGILETNSIFAAQVAGMKIATYFFHYQLPVASCVITSVAISHFFVQRAFDKKDKNINHEQAEQKTLDNVPPLYYAILPVMPLILMLGSLVPRPRRADEVRTASGGGDVTEFDCDDVC